MIVIITRESQHRYNWYHYAKTHYSFCRGKFRLGLASCAEPAFHTER